MRPMDVHIDNLELDCTVNPGTGPDWSVSLKTGEGPKLQDGSGLQSGSESASNESEGRPSIMPKLKGLVFMALVVGAGMAYKRLRARRSGGESESMARESETMPSRS